MRSPVFLPDLMQDRAQVPGAPFKPNATVTQGCDKWLDVQLGRAVGARAILVRTGNGAAEELQPPEGVTADVVVDNLAAAAEWIESILQSEI